MSTEETEERILRAATNLKLDSMKDQYEKASAEEKSKILLNMLLWHMGQTQLKPESFDENKRQGLLELGLTEDHISILKLKIDERQ